MRDGIQDTKDDTPDRNCYTLPNGDCASGKPCMHTGTETSKDSEPFVIEATPEAIARDWPEDFNHENGHYWCRCIVCRKPFQGHKRRVLCKVCAHD